MSRFRLYPTAEQRTAFAGHCQALRDFAQAMATFFGGTHRRPTWRKAGRSEGFRVVGGQAQKVRRLNRRFGEVWVPKAGWVRFAWSRNPPAAKSYRVTEDRVGHWLARSFDVIAVEDLNADVNAARNILARALGREREPAAGRAVTARGGDPSGKPANREPQLVHTS